MFHWSTTNDLGLLALRYDRHGMRNSVETYLNSRYILSVDAEPIKKNDKNYHKVVLTIECVFDYALTSESYEYYLKGTDESDS